MKKEIPTSITPTLNEPKSTGFYTKWSYAKHLKRNVESLSLDEMKKVTAQLEKIKKGLPEVEDSD